MMEETQDSSSVLRSLGFKFCPTDQELVTYYLYGKITGQLSDMENQIPVKSCDLYGKEPWEMWEEFGGDKLSDFEHLFFFTSIKKVASGGSNIIRRVGTSVGTWHGETSGKSSVLHYAGLTAYKKRFNYRNPSRLDQDRCWNMLEYSLDGWKSSFVLCQLKRSRKQKSNKRKHNDDDIVEVSDIVLYPDSIKRYKVERQLSNNFQDNQDNDIPLLLSNNNTQENQERQLSNNFQDNQDNDIPLLLSNNNTQENQETVDVASVMEEQNNLLALLLSDDFDQDTFTPDDLDTFWDFPDLFDLGKKP